MAATAKAIKGLAELVKGNVESGKRNKSQPFSLCFYSSVIKFVYVYLNGEVVFAAESLFRGVENHESCKGNVAHSYGEYLHATGNFETAKEMYQKAIQGVEETKESMCSCNMNLKAVSLAATFALGQLQSHIG